MTSAEVIVITPPFVILSAAKDLIKIIRPQTCLPLGGGVAAAGGNMTSAEVIVITPPFVILSAAKDLIKSKKRFFVAVLLRMTAEGEAPYNAHNPIQIQNPKKERSKKS